MECDMVEYVLNKMDKEDKNKTSLGNIRKAFLEEIMRDDEASLTVDEQPMNQQNAIFDPCSNVAEQVFGNYGWKVGAIVALGMVDPKTPKADVQLEIG